LKPLKAITVLGLLPNDVKHRIDELGPLGVMALGPVISSPGLTKNEVIGPEDLAIRPGPHAVHGTRLQIHEHSTGHESPTAGLIKVNINPFEL
jgi:hypothetical protein